MLKAGLQRNKIKNKIFKRKTLIKKAKLCNEKNEKCKKTKFTIVMAARPTFLGNGYRTFSKSQGETVTVLPP